MSGKHIKKRSIKLDGHRTSISMENEFWDDLVSLASKRRHHVNALVAAIDADRPEGVNLSSAIRLFLYRRLKAKNPTP